jgi:hypothetical protein
MSDRPSRGGCRPTWWHKLGDAPPAFVAPPARILPNEIASVERRDETYLAMLRRHLALSDEHRADLHRRGFTDEEIEERGYASTPSAQGGRILARTLSAQLDLSGVPGFFRSGGEWRMVDVLPGYFVPYRDPRGKIQGLQYRLDAPLNGGKTKYLWLSSSGKARGASSGSPLHHVGRKYLPDAGAIWLTEGALKADCASFLLDVPFIAAAGLSFGQDFGARFKLSFPDKSAILAFDSDFQTNENVRAALHRLVDDLIVAGVRYTIRTWRGAKGIDDYALSLSQTKVRAA